MALLHVLGEQHDFVDDDGDAGKKLRVEGRQPVDDRFQMTDLPEVVRKEIARLFAESFGDADEVLDIQPALIRFQPGQLRGRDPHAPGHFGLASPLRFAELSEDLAIHGDR